MASQPDYLVIAANHSTQAKNNDRVNYVEVLKRVGEHYHSGGTLSVPQLIHEIETNGKQFHTALLTNGKISAGAPVTVGGKGDKKFISTKANDKDEDNLKSLPVVMPD